MHVNSNIRDSPAGKFNLKCMTLEVLSLSGALKNRPQLIEIYSFKKKKN